MYRALMEPYKLIALRHIVIADTLLNARFHDGAAFHMYHAYESIICSALLKRQPYRKPPLPHLTKLERFKQVFARERGLVTESTRLSYRLYPIRNRVLYPELREFSAVIMPTAAVSEKQVRRYLSHVKQFANLLIGHLKL